ncbi:phage tail protein [Aliiglaciecola sp. 2_MG-2023]|uniref:phage tail protein n=1 Tax=unclassified Aliiglaciecola TaxID=2593648 RepID=UPI0026E30DB5|nr:MULTISPECIES: phage tail protein [unclassified Aliiglaciecola]MDO6710284.1 phage tail protein [Aliiglaciecola sp. 2_MG-2023]MDO6751432.1 phage tail protein [Aliiglaciecola sp. 1_MG-2023]
MSQFAMIAGVDQWMRVAHENTSVDIQQQIVQLAWHHQHLHDSHAFKVKPAGLTFDPWCRLYHSVPEDNGINKLLWTEKRQPSLAKSLFHRSQQVYGEFVGQQVQSDLSLPIGLAVDKKGRLFIADSGNQRILIFDLIDNTLLRSVHLDGTPSVIRGDGQQVFVVVSPVTPPDMGNQLNQSTSLVRFDATSMPIEMDLKFPNDVSDLAINSVTVNTDGRIFVLLGAGEESAVLWAIDGENELIDVPFASDILATDDNMIVVSGAPNADFQRFRITPNSIAQMPHLQAPYYDGRGMALDPFGKVVYWSAKGLMYATVAKIQYSSQGRIVCFRLDNNEMQRRWGRIFIDACLPVGTSIKLGYIVSDEHLNGPQVDATAPQNIGEYELTRPDLTPPLPSKLAVNEVLVSQKLHRRSQNRELPWSFSDEPWRTYEAPVNAPPGRYLWLVIDLFGKSHASPKIKNIRVEYPALDLLRRLPRVFSEQGAASDFLHRYLTLLNTNFDELEQRSDTRHCLLDPLCSPISVLPWLSSLLGIELDNRWPETTQRQIIKHAMWLFKYRGTVAGLKRFIEIYLQRDITIIEHYQVRGLGGAFVGEDDSLAANSILGAGFRIGGKLGEADTTSVINEQDSNAADVQSSFSYSDAIALHAHKFSVIVPLILDEEKRAVIEHILEVHRPAHTVFDICSVDSGMRVGTGLHLGMSSVVGQSSGFGQLQIGKSILGTTDVLGQAKSGTIVGNSQVGFDSRVG